MAFCSSFVAISWMCRNTNGHVNTKDTQARREVNYLKTKPVKVVSYWCVFSLNTGVVESSGGFSGAANSHGTCSLWCLNRSVLAGGLSHSGGSVAVVRILHGSCHLKVTVIYIPKKYSVK